MAQDTQGKTAIITGACSGIGLEFARLLLQNGSNVLIADLSLSPEAEKLIEEYYETPKAVFHKTDVTLWADLIDMFRATEYLFGSIDIVCPGAGIFEPLWSNFWHPPGTPKSNDDALSGRYQILDINLTHPIRVTQLAISHFLSAPTPSSPSNPKSIVHIASIAGQIASLVFPLYHVSKHGLQALVRSLGDLESLIGIRVTAVEPGMVKTRMWTEQPEKLKAFAEGSDRWVTPQEVAQVMLACVKETKINSVPGVNGGQDAVSIDIHGGSCLEVLADQIRDVPLFDNAGPYATGATGASITNAEALFADISDLLIPGWGKA